MRNWWIKKLAIVCMMLISLSLASCGGTSSSPGNGSGPTPNPGSPTFTITAATEYPVSGESSIFVIVTNNSKVNATNVNYTVSGTSLQNGAIINVESQNITSISGTCTQTSISAGAVCILPVQVLNNTNPGSITITITGIASGTALVNLWNKMILAVGLKASSSGTSPATTIGLINVPANAAANQILNANSTESTLVMFTVLVESTNPTFNTINLVNSDGSAIPSASQIGGAPTSGNYTTNSVATFTVVLPPATSLNPESVQATFNGCPGNYCSNQA